MPAPPPLPGLIEYDHPAAPQIGRWMRLNVLTSTPENGPCYKLVIKHYSINKKPQGDVTQIPVPSSLENDAGGIDALISQVTQAAQEDSNNLHSGIQLYAVHAHYKKNPHYAPRCYFRVNAEEEYDPETAGGDPSEPSTQQGLVAQLMRHCEGLMKTSVMNTSYLIDTLRQDNANQRLLIHQQAEQSIEMGAIIQESLDNFTERRIKEREAETKQTMMSAVFEHLKLLFPVILNKIAGQPVAPETDPSFNLLAALFESMSQEQQQALVTQFLKPEQIPLFAEFLETYDKRKKALTSNKPSSDQPLNLTKLYDTIKDQTARDQTQDPKLANLEQHAKSFRDTFKMVPSFTGPIKPAPTR
jgi:hypothetical protein